LTATAEIQLRRVAAKVLEKREWFALEELTGKGIRPGARWMAKPSKGRPLKVAIRTSRDRTLGFSRIGNGAWRTLETVDLVLAIVPTGVSTNSFELLCFDSNGLQKHYGDALNALAAAGRSPDLDVPVFIPLDERSKKNVGHEIANLKMAARWAVPFSVKDQEAGGDSESFFDRVKREFATMNNVDVNKVSVEFRILA